MIVVVTFPLSGRFTFRCCPQVKKQLWNSNFWSEGYFVSTVGPQGNENAIANYVCELGTEQGDDQLYQQLYRAHSAPSTSHRDQLTLF